jgi:RecA-family ATPase
MSTGSMKLIPLAQTPLGRILVNPPANDNKPKSLQAPDQVKADLKDRFQITWFDDVDKTTTKQEIVQGVLGAGEFSLFVAKPGMGKSVLVGDIGLHIAAGMEWHGRNVKKGLVVFFAAERKRLTERRVAAWRKKHNVTGIPFVVVGGKLDLTTGLIDAKALGATIKSLEEKSGFKCVLIILDTVTRTFGPGDQHQSRDM